MVWYACGYPEEVAAGWSAATKRVRGEQPEEEINVLALAFAVILSQAVASPKTARELLTRAVDVTGVAEVTTAKRHKELNSLGIAYRYTDEHDKGSPS